MLQNNDSLSNGTKWSALTNINTHWTTIKPTNLIIKYNQNMFWVSRVHDLPQKQPLCLITVNIDPLTSQLERMSSRARPSGHKNSWSSLTTGPPPSVTSALFMLAVSYIKKVSKTVWSTEVWCCGASEPCLSTVV